MMTLDELNAFNARMFTLMTTELATLPLDVLLHMHDDLVDANEEAGASNQEAPASFALKAVLETLRIKVQARGLN